MPIGFHTRYCETVTTDFRIFKFLTAIELTDTNGDRYKIPVAGYTDLASVPRVFQGVLPPSGEYALEAATHDGGYQNWLLKWDGNSWVKANLTKQECDGLFWRLMQLNQNITTAQKEILYNAVVLCGAHAFKEDRE